LQEVRGAESEIGLTKSGDNLLVGSGRSLEILQYLVVPT
jgi:hypothetical protein